MSILRVGTFLLVFCVIASPTVARNDRYTFPLQPTLDSPDFSQRIGSSVKFVFGDEPAPAGEKVAEYVANDRQHFHGMTEEGACRNTLLTALSDLRDRAAGAGADAVVGIVSYFRRVTFSSATEFECHVGSSGVFVSLKGTLVKLQK
jgi:uncharacterized protein YbjQ (UPF0145 family)